MRLRQLEDFVAICEAGSFNGAASELRVAQPSRSQQVRAMEKELGAVVLERGRQGVSLTAAGRIFLPRARAVSVDEVAGESTASIPVGPSPGRSCGSTAPSSSASDPEERRPWP